MADDRVSESFDLDGTVWTKEGYIPPIVRLYKDVEMIKGEVDNPIAEFTFKAGWYHCDEVEQIIGPFANLDEAVAAYKEYFRTL